MEQQAVLGKKIRYIDPRSSDYTTYFDYLLAYNETLHRAISRGLNKSFPASSHAAIITAGSDARLEKGPTSLMEFVALLDTPEDEAFVAQLMDDFIQREGLEQFFDPNREFKYVGSASMSNCVFNKGTSQEFSFVSPNRLFDGVFLGGDSNVYLEAKTLLEEEMRSPEGKSILDAVNKKSRTHRHVSETGKQIYKGNEITHYNPLEGLSYYDPDHHVTSFKQGPLRAVQFAVTRDIIRTLRESKTYKIFFDVPSNTVGRINALAVEGFLGISDQEARDLADSYKFFLQSYHIAQEAYRQRGEKTVGFDATEAANRIRDLTAICAKRIVVPENSAK